MTRDEIIAAKADLSHANLIGADLSCADLSHANLIGADLCCADLSGADLSCADLRDADLRDASLSGADLCCADLRGANLNGADLNGADLRDASLRGAILTDATGYIDLGTDKRGHHFRAVLHDTGWIINAGCRWFTIAEAIAHWTDTKNKDALARVAIVQAHLNNE
jgi:hypothetical protein